MSLIKVSLSAFRRPACKAKLNFSPSGFANLTLKNRRKLPLHQLAKPERTQAMPLLGGDADHIAGPTGRIPFLGFHLRFAIDNEGEVLAILVQMAD